jgi:hypothetical protein
MSIAKDLPAEKAAEVVDFARFLRRRNKARRRPPARSKALGNAQDDAEWERIISDPRPRHKLTAMLDVLAREEREGKIEPMDFSKSDV